MHNYFGKYKTLITHNLTTTKSGQTVINKFETQQRLQKYWRSNIPGCNYDRPVKYTLL